jgi:ribonuclease HI
MLPKEDRAVTISSPHDAIVYSDGECNPNPGPGAWACIIVESTLGQKREFSGFEPHTTNNRAEMAGPLVALDHLTRVRIEREPGGPLVVPRRVLLVSDSRYLLSGIEWVDGWMKRGWRTKSGSPVVNRDLWECVVEFKSRFRIDRQWVRGHSGHPENERCDEICRMLILTRGEKGADS